MNAADHPIVKELVLIGGGHAHVAVLKSFGMCPIPGVRLTLISPQVATAYSGMLPGYLAGHYGFDETHVDLVPLTRFAGAQFYRDTVVGIDHENSRIQCKNHPPVHFDLVSIDTGSTPAKADIPGAGEHAIAVRPIDRFLISLEDVEKRLHEMRNGHFRIAVVGGGAGGVELTLSLHYRFMLALQGESHCDYLPDFHLFTDLQTILPTHNLAVQRKFSRILKEREIRLHLGHRVSRIEPGRLITENGVEMEAEAIFLLTQAAAPSWPAKSGLRTDEEGFIAVRDTLQSVSHPRLFGAGDVASVIDHPRPKSGVFAVRQGPPLAENLRRALQGLALRPFHPQRRFLSLISTGNRYAVASRGVWAVEGKWVWRAKNWIDRRWMRKYQELPEMEEAPRAESVLVGHGEIQGASMRCGGCGGKIGSSVLMQVLARLPDTGASDRRVVAGLESLDDAAVMSIPEGGLQVQSVDSFRTFLPDPFVFGQVTATHCLGDIFAMGAQPRTAQALAVVPLGNDAAMEEQLFQVVSGAVSVLQRHRASLVGGHSSEGSELAFGMVVDACVDPEKLVRKSGLRPGHVLILTKALGTGALFAAEMRRKARGRWIEGAVESMLQSNAAAAAIFSRYGVAAGTDVTGFGLMGHLVDLLRASSVDAELSIDAIPVLEGAREVMQREIASSIQPQNRRFAAFIAESDDAATHAHVPILFDPQTSGGLLAGIPPASADECLEELRRAGYLRATVIGKVTERGGDDPRIELTV